MTKLHMVNSSDDRQTIRLSIFLPILTCSLYNFWNNSSIASSNDSIFSSSNFLVTCYFFASNPDKSIHRTRTILIWIFMIWTLSSIGTCHLYLWIHVDKHISPNNKVVTQSPKSKLIALLGPCFLHPRPPIKHHRLAFRSYLTTPWAKKKKHPVGCRKAPNQIRFNKELNPSLLVVIITLNPLTN